MVFAIVILSVPVLPFSVPRVYDLQYGRADKEKTTNQVEQWVWESNNRQYSDNYTVTRVDDQQHLSIYHVSLPPFPWGMPLGLDKESAAWFWAQPENYRHFNDSLKWTGGEVYEYHDCSLHSYLDVNNNVTHYTNWRNQPVSCEGEREQSKYRVVFALFGHEIGFFQHFLDNGVPHLELMLLATNYSASEVVVAIQQWRVDSIPQLIRRRGFADVVPFGSSVSARSLVLARVVPVVHPLFHRRFTDALRIERDGDQVDVYVSRTHGDGTKSSRLIENQNEVVSLLTRIFPTLVVFRPSSRNLEQALSLFGRARFVVGSHGGGLYNILFAVRKDVRVVEIIPIRSSGEYPDQWGLTAIPPFAHLAIWTLAEMNGMRFYRFYQPAQSLNFRVDLARFERWLEKVVESDS